MHGGCVCGSDRYRPTCSYGRQSSIFRLTGVICFKNFNGSAMPPTPTCSRSFSTFSRSFRRETLPKRVSDDSRQLNFRRKKFCSTIFFRVGHRFSSFWASFGASTGKRTSPSTSPQFFALDAAIMRSVRPKIDEKLAVGACTGGGGGGGKNPT